MKQTPSNLSKLVLPAMLALSLASCAFAQTPTPDPAKAPAEKPQHTQSASLLDPHRRDRDYSQDSTKTFYLNAGSGANDANEILTAIRLMLDPSVKLYLTPSDNALSVRGLPEDIAQAGRLIEELNKPRKIYRLTYTITDMDGGKKIGVQHFAMAIPIGGRTTLKNGSKIPVATGSYSAKGDLGQQTQFQYLDIGLNFDASLDAGADAVRLRSKIEQSSVTEDKTIAMVIEPIVRQTVMEQTAFLTPGKPLVLGSIDVAGSTRHLEIEALLEPIK